MVGWVGVSMWFETYSTLRYQILTFWLKIWYLGFLFPLLWCQPSSLPHLTCGAPWLDVGRVITLWGILLHWRWGNAEGVPQPEQHFTSLRSKSPVKLPLQFPGLAVPFAVFPRLLGVKAATKGAASLALSWLCAKAVTVSTASVPCVR